ncbi:MAG: FtsX-like permease family protein [Bacteroides sp.]|nr:FtsX-like permease family protein [Bacteroides sp.]
MKLEAGIAWRYLWKKKSHGAVSAIAAVSVVGVAVAAAALICVLSVFNGFREVLTGQNDRILPDVEVTVSRGKAISDGDSLAAAIGRLEGVAVSSPVVSDQALAIYAQREMPVMLLGVVSGEFRKYTMIDSLIVAGSTLPDDCMAEDPPAGLISAGVAVRLGAYSPGDRLLLFAPRREGRINMANPAASFRIDSIAAAGVFESRQQDIDATTVVVPIEIARALLDYDLQATSVAVKARPGVDPGRLAAEISAAVGDTYTVRDRARQQETSFRMVEIEKWVTGLLLVFILIIASFNIISTMTMFVLEKRAGMQTLRALGMTPRRIGGIFWWESLYITVLGAVTGLLAGVGLCLLQERFGLIRMGGDPARMIVQSYPVALQWSDLWIAGVPIAAIGLFTSWIASSFARSRIAEKRR